MDKTYQESISAFSFTQDATPASCAKVNCLFDPSLTPTSWDFLAHTTTSYIVFSTTFMPKTPCEVLNGVKLLANTTWL